MKRIKNVTKQELKASLLQSLEHNAKALDYIENVLNKAKDNLGYDPEDKDYQEIVETLEYIKFVLEYVDNQYNESLKKVGAKFGFIK